MSLRAVWVKYQNPILKKKKNKDQGKSQQGQWKSKDYKR
jgi:hypothetical protein